MRGGRKNLKQGALEGRFELQTGQSIMKVVGLRGSNIIEVEDADGPSTLCLLPAKFNKTLWVRKGSFVVVNDGEREKALKAGSKVTGIICQVLFEDQIRALKRTSKWPTGFTENAKQPSSERENCADSNGSEEISCSDFRDPHQIADFSLDGNDENSSEDESLPPLEANQNRTAANIGFFVSSSSDEDEDRGEDHA